MADKNFGRNRQRSGSGGSGAQGDRGFVPERSAGLPWKLLVFSFVLLLFTIFVFLGLKFGYGAYLESQQEQIDEEFDALSSRLAPADQEDFLIFYSQMTNLQDVLTSRHKIQNILAFLENNTLPLVYFRDAEYSAEERTLSLNGNASSLRTLVEQLSILESNSNIESISVGQINVEDGDARFNMEIVIGQNYLRQLTQ